MLGATWGDLPGDPVPPEVGGMSVNADPRQLPAPLRPSWVEKNGKRGTGMLPMYEIAPRVLTASGDLTLNPAQPHRHASVEPSRGMPRAAYQSALCITRGEWGETTEDVWKKRRHSS